MLMSTKLFVALLLVLATPQSMSENAMIDEPPHAAQLPVVFAASSLRLSGSVGSKIHPVWIAESLSDAIAARANTRTPVLESADMRTQVPTNQNRKDFVLPIGKQVALRPTTGNELLDRLRLSCTRRDNSWDQRLLAPTCRGRQAGNFSLAA